MPKFSVEITEGARRDLNKIHDTIKAQRGERDADAFLDKLETAANSLEEFPRRGSVPTELQALGSDAYRQLLVDPYKLVYEVQESTVFVVLIIHTKRDFLSLLQERLLGAPSDGDTP